MPHEWLTPPVVSQSGLLAVEFASPRGREPQNQVGNASGKVHGRRLVRERTHDHEPERRGKGLS